MADKAQLIVAASETDANLYYATGFWAPDPFIFARVGGKKILIMSDLEIDRAREQSHVDEILSMTKLQREMKKQSNGTGLAGLIVTLFKEREVDQVEVPSSFPLGLADQLRQEGLQLTVAEDPFLPERTVKRPEEVEAIRQAIRKTEDAIASVIELIRGSQIKGEDLWIRERPLTSELVRKTLHLTLMGGDCLARETIVAGGAQGCDPHCIGSGPLKAHWPIVLDVFPMSMESRYYADISRTVVKGKASEKVRRMYLAVQEGQEIAFGKLKAGVDGKEIHEAILDHFKSEGFKTGEENGRMVGFFHGTGHGLGLEIHEPPRISPVSDILKAGQVVTVEPGLYYPDAGGVRIEDDVLVTETGFENLTQAPKILEIDS